MWVWASSVSWLVMDREAWRAAIHGVTKSWTWLSDWTEPWCSSVHVLQSCWDSERKELASKLWLQEEPGKGWGENSCQGLALLLLFMEKKRKSLSGYLPSPEISCKSPHPQTQTCTQVSNQTPGDQCTSNSCSPGHLRRQILLKGSQTSVNQSSLSKQKYIIINIHETYFTQFIL